MSKLYFEPHARLLTMLGDQLIADQRTALTELIKNSYDADASHVQIHFNGIRNSSKGAAKPEIFLSDDGLGITEDKIKKVWTRPATPHKKNLSPKDRRTDLYKRIIQGEKGIGRFALLKLARNIELITRPKGSGKEYVLTLDLTRYDDEFLSEELSHEDGVDLVDQMVHVNPASSTEIATDSSKLADQSTKQSEEKVKKEILLKDIEIDFAERLPAVFTGEVKTSKYQLSQKHGVAIRLAELKSEWNESKLRRLQQEIFRLQSLDVRTVHDKDGDECPELTVSSDFKVNIFLDGEEISGGQVTLDNLNEYIRSQSILSVTEGRFNADREEFNFLINGSEARIGLQDQVFTGLKVFRDYREELEMKESDAFTPQCGPFTFSFFIFDFAAKNHSKKHLSPHAKGKIKEHRVYLYRDGIRVHPYGDPDDDWLEIDMLRGTYSAGQFFSNDQIIGVIHIAYADNPGLTDKTSREGLLDTGRPKSDFLMLIRAFLSWLRTVEYQAYKIKERSSENVTNLGLIKKNLADLKSLMENENEFSFSKASNLLTQLSKNYKVESEAQKARLANTEELAGVGLSIEASAHDIVSLAEKAINHIDILLKESSLDKEKHDRLVTVRGIVSYIHTSLADIQDLFRPARRRKKLVDIQTVLDRVIRLLSPVLERRKIKVEVEERGKLTVPTTEAVILQVLLNLFDNSIYWFGQRVDESRLIRVVLDADNDCILYSDSGPGIDESHAPYIFEPFFSGKGESGKGLGLYIAKSILNRQGHSIEVVHGKVEGKLRGAAFRISFEGKKNG